jgi:hypothetical protein
MQAPRAHRQIAVGWLPPTAWRAYRAPAAEFGHVSPYDLRGGRADGSDVARGLSVHEGSHACRLAPQLAPLGLTSLVTATTASPLNRASRDITSVELMGRYSNPDIVSRLRRVLSGQGRDRVSHRPVPSLRQKQTRLTDSQRSALVERYLTGESSNALAAEFGIDRRTATAIILRAGAELRYRVELTDAEIDGARELYEARYSLAKVGGEVGCVFRDDPEPAAPSWGPDACGWDEPVESATQSHETGNGMMVAPDSTQRGSSDARCAPRT